MKNQLVISDPEILSGIPIFNGTRVPVKTLLDYLEAGDSLEEFLDDFPTVKKEKVLMLLNHKELIAKIQIGEIVYI
ncbi:MAG: DUF433 domain-containing protein [Pseudanabaena sp. CAN_BIN31]|nr:DUF433 domain-containing protein [Pseudanabaena sp. CAN_BIN31]